MGELSKANGFNRAKLAGIADGLVVAVAVSLPWSTSATAILVVIWLFALIPTLAWADARRELATAAGGLPVLLVVVLAVEQEVIDAARIGSARAAVTGHLAASPCGRSW